MVILEEWLYFINTTIILLYKLKLNIVVCILKEVSTMEAQM